MFGASWANALLLPPAGGTAARASLRERRLRESSSSPLSVRQRRVGAGGTSGVVVLCDALDMMFRSFADIEALIRSSWSEKTCDPEDLPEWSPENPARGQCAVTALVVQDLLGGELLLAEVRNADGSRQGVHYWNRFADGVEVDLTREQFTRSEVVQAPTVVARPADPNAGRLAAQYQAHVSEVRAGLPQPQR